MEKLSGPKVQKFMKYEKIILRLQLIILGSGIFIYLTFLAFLERLKNVNDLFVFVVWVGMILPMLLLVVSVIRILKYFISVIHLDEESSIWRSALSFVFSPLNIVIFYILFIILVFASCAANA